MLFKVFTPAHQTEADAKLTSFAYNYNREQLDAPARSRRERC